MSLGLKVVVYVFTVYKHFLRVSCEVGSVLGAGDAEVSEYGA